MKATRRASPAAPPEWQVLRSAPVLLAQQVRVPVAPWRPPALVWVLADRLPAWEAALAGRQAGWESQARPGWESQARPVWVFLAGHARASPVRRVSRVDHNRPKRPSRTSRT